MGDSSSIFYPSQVHEYPKGNMKRRLVVTGEVASDFLPEDIEHEASWGTISD